MTIGSRMRFEILKRDGYTCQYCGRKPPEIVLELDHIKPRSAGGEDVPENLIVACRDCNRGKSASGVLEGTDTEEIQCSHPDCQEKVIRGYCSKHASEPYVSGWEDGASGVIHELMASLLAKYGKQVVDSIDYYEESPEAVYWNASDVQPTNEDPSRPWWLL